MKKYILLIALLACTFTLNAQQIGKDARYCNPLPMPMGQGGTATGDVSVFQHEDTYYMFCTGGGAWYSKDMLNWEYKYVEHVPVAPDVAYYNGKFYLTGNESPVYVANNPLGPYTLYSDWKNTPSVEDGWNYAFDTHIYVDEDNKPYLFWPGFGASGIFVSELDPNDISRLVGEPKHLFSFNPAHKFESYGEVNEYQSVAWVEGPWVYKYGDTYYLQYACSGTQWKAYAAGYYTSKNIMGPYTFGSNNPLLKKTDGVVTGASHGSMVTGPDGGIWQFYTAVLSNPPGGRRIGMDRVYVDEDGLLSCKVTETPQWAPNVKLNPKHLNRGNSGSFPISINKFNASEALSTVSSVQVNSYAQYAVDNYTGTIWLPEESDKTPNLMLDLSPATRFDNDETFILDGVRILFGVGRKGGVSGLSGSMSGVRRSPEYVPSIYKYKIEASIDGTNWKVVLDKSNSTDSKNTIFEEISPVECRYVKLTVLEWPSNTALGVIDYTLFGTHGNIDPRISPTSTKRIN